MLTKIMQKGKNLFNQIISDHWGDFKEKHPKYDTPQYNEVIEKTLNCGMEQGGYAEYR